MAAIYIIENDACVNCIDSTLEKAAQFFPDAELVERSVDTGFDIGWTRVNGVWTAPDVSASELPTIEFLKRIPMAKRIAIRQAQANNPVINDIMGLLDAAEVIHKNDPDTVASLGYLVQNGFLTQSDVDAIWQ